MTKKKSGLFATFALAGTLLLAGCGGGEESTSSGGGSEGGGEAANPEFLSVLTGGTTGTYYPLGGAMAQIIETETGIDTTAESSQASAANMTALADGSGQIAFVQTDTAFYASEGTNMFEGEVIDTVSAIGALYPETIQLVTTEGSGITSFEDLAGKSVSVGAPGSGTYINAEQLLEIHGMTMEDVEAQNLDFAESQESLQSGQIEAAFITAGTPTGAVEGLSATADVAIVPVAQDKADALIEKYPYYAHDTVPADTYGIPEEVPTVSVLAMLVVQNDLSEDLVYDITKAIYENTDQIQHAKAAFIKPETALEGIGIPVHPGAQRYFDEVNQ
ncbi:TAXI family TRAP transporter solute-binding subunit [Planomicrobium sp. CPCC 101079]|uniref:TAXI family TRAP transporter solute-binding subunit n=1 Tax=Planomicrobium sp. CPCC 101079 TaxID=2599618 RepID=UPI0011B717B6|nr:TAXI family TRAP transporter solute-binding subunit [Planomicrobium sp. CPCC 101079]TWT04830.1 TAXI family TRAP transporter solute-binding subunit [Planomicrobium sp. CPCC 101079]